MHAHKSILVLALGVFAPISAVPAGIMKSPASIVNGMQTGEALSNNGPAGDLNHDGFADVLIGSATYDNGQTDEGRVQVFLGSATGLQPQPAWSAESNEVEAYFGYDLGSGDFNGDGTSDIVASAFYADNGAFLFAGRVLVWYGGAVTPGNPAGLGPNGTFANADWQQAGATDNAYAANIAIGNFNG